MIQLELAFSFLAQTEDADQGASWWQTIQSGGFIGYLIIGLSVIAMALIVMHLVQIRRNALVPTEQLDQIDQLLSTGNVSAALEYCLDPANDSYLCRILTSGLTRYQKSAFGAFEIKNAIEESGEDQTAKLYRSTDGLGVIGAIAPLLGLLGTVVGMVGAFGTLSATAAINHEELAENISLALITTVLGLIVAIPCVALFTYFRNRIDALASEAGMEIERLVLHLESAHASPAGLRPAATSPPRQAPAPLRPQPAARPASPTQTAPATPAAAGTLRAPLANPGNAGAPSEPRPSGSGAP